MTTTISIRTNSALKKKASKIFDSYGLNMSSAFNMYMTDIVEGRTRPTSDIRYVPDHIMERWEKEKNEAVKSGKYFTNVKDFMLDLKSK